jgi:uncharacterized membrane protein
MKLIKLTRAAAIGAAYAALTVIAAPISYGPLQFRIAEALCVLPWFFPESIWGLFVGCAIANLLGGNGPLDVVLGSLATLIAAFCTSKIKSKILACLPPALINGVIVGAMLAWVLSRDIFLQAFITYGAQVFLGEIVVMYVLGLPLMTFLPKTPFFKSIFEKH